MKVYVNDCDVEIFRGGRAKDAILKYLGQQKMRSCKKLPEIKDEYGNVISEDSPMRENSKIYFILRLFILLVAWGTTFIVSEQEVKAENGKADNIAIPTRSSTETYMQDSSPLVRAWFAVDALPYYSEYHVFKASTTDPQERILFSAITEVTDFKVLALSDCNVDENGKISFHEKTLYTQPRLMPQCPLVVIMTFFGSIPNNGFSYTDENGTTRKFVVGLSGMDGSVEIEEY